jgi:hypothetical protein
MEDATAEMIKKKLKKDGVLYIWSCDPCAKHNLDKAQILANRIGHAVIGPNSNLTVNIFGSTSILPTPEGEEGALVRIEPDKTAVVSDGPDYPPKKKK